jgi:hypothetical protein
MTEFMQLIIDSDWIHNSEISKLCAGKTPQLVKQEAQAMLETVIRLYFARHNFEFYDPWVAFALTITGNIAVNNLAESSGNDARIVNGYRSTLILSAQGLNKQSPNYHISTLLAIQLEKAMKSEELKLVQTYTKASRVAEIDRALIEEHAYSQWPIPGMAGFREDPERVKLVNLLNYHH